jgi:hypothetical protein
MFIILYYVNDKSKFDLICGALIFIVGLFFSHSKRMKATMDTDKELIK